MEATLLWLLERKALTLSGFVVVLLGAFIPWPSEVIAILLVILGAVLMLAQIPFAMRAAQKVPVSQRQFPEIPSIPASSGAAPITPTPFTAAPSHQAAATPSAATQATYDPRAPAHVPAGQPEAQRGD